MANELRASGHTVGETNLHLQFTPAYRRDIFSDKLVGELTVAYVLQRSKEMKVDIVAIGSVQIIFISLCVTGRPGKYEFLLDRGKLL